MFLTITTPEKLEVNYETYGSGDPVFFFPGGGAEISHYGSFFRALAQHFLVIAINSPGFSSKTSPTVPISIPYYVEYMQTVVKHFDFEENSVIGHSMGGGIALALSATTPKLIKKSVLFAPVLTTFPCTQAELAAKVTINYVKGKVRPNKDLQPFLEKLKDSLPAMSQIQQQGHMLTKDFTIPLEKTDATEKLVFLGKKDVLLPYKQQLKLLQRVPNKRVITFENDGHDLMFSKKDEVISQVTDFLKHKV